MRTALLLVAVAGCTHHKDITEAHELIGEEVEVSGMYGQSVTAVGVNGPSGITFVDKATGGVVPDQEIYKIDDTSHVLGGVQGLGIGGAIGAIGGALLGYADGDDACDEDSHGGCFLSFTAGEKAALFGIVFGVLGGGVGLVVGAVKGSTTLYERRFPGVSIKPGGPPGSVAGIDISF